MRGPLIRSLAGSLAACVVIVGLAPAFGEPCPFHDPAFATLAASSSHLASSSASSAEMKVHSPAAHRQSNAHHGLGSHRNAHGCSCIGCGCCATSLTLNEQPLGFAPASVSAGSRAPFAPPAAPALLRADHTLPFSTAPPADLRSASRRPALG
jgi:hypothetical protein